MSPEGADVWPPTRWHPALPGFTAPFTMTIVGDARVEFRTTLSEVEFGQLTSNQLVYSEIATTMAGTAVNLARQAAAYFARVNVVAKVGDDAFTPAIAESVRSAGARPVLKIATGMANGLTLVIRDRAGNRPAGTRLLIAGNPAPGQFLSPADVRDSADLLTASDIVVCDGYSLLAETSAAAAAEVVRLLEPGRQLLCLDLVPHDIDSRVDHRLVCSWLAAADIVIAEARTLGRLAGVPLAAYCTEPEVGTLLRQLPAAGPRRPLWLIRYGPDDMNDTLVYRAGDICRSYPTGYRDVTEKMGFGDRLAAAELAWWLARNRPAGRTGSAS